MSADLAKNLLLFGGIPALGLGVFFLLLQGGFGSFKFEPISSTMAAIVALAFLAVVAFIAYIALTRFDAPVAAPRVSHNGELLNLIAHLGKDPNAPILITLGGSSEDQNVLGKLYFDDTYAPTYVTLIEKMCAAKAECIKCDVQQQTQTIVSISKTGNIAPTCKTDGSAVYCCA